MKSLKSEVEVVKLGDILIADKWCGFPDNTTKGKEYKVVQVRTYADRQMFWIIDDKGQKRFPISTTFKRK